MKIAWEYQSFVKSQQKILLNSLKIAMESHKKKLFRFPCSNKWFDEKTVEMLKTSGNNQSLSQGLWGWKRSELFSEATLQIAQQDQKAETRSLRVQLATCASELSSAFNDELLWSGTVHGDIVDGRFDFRRSSYQAPVWQTSIHLATANWICTTIIPLPTQPNSTKYGQAWRY